jgi:hypothetical protein
MTARERILQQWFQLTVLEWELISAFQKHVCFICGKPNKSGNRLSTDHDHRKIGPTAGLIRGLLCATCNRILGKIEDPRFWKDDTIAKLARLIEYLKNPPAVEALGRKIFIFPGKLGSDVHRAWLKKNSNPIGTVNRKEKHLGS